MKLKCAMTVAATALTMIVGGATSAATAGSDDTGGALDRGERRAAPGTPDSQIGLAILAGGGVTNFTQGAARDETGVGGSWDVRVLIATRTWFGFEGSYIGGANPITALGSSANSKLVRNGLEGALRVQAPLRYRTTLLEPYVLGGLGWNTYRITYVNLNRASASANGDNTVAVPLGAGFMVGHQGFLADLRYTIRPTYEQTILGGQGRGGLTNWDAGAMIGFEF
jgi:hypothetical protein